MRLSNSRGVPYFFNVNTKQSSWEPPSGLTKEQINSLPGAKEYLSKSSTSGGAPGQVRASHLLVKHRGSRRPSSWKEVSFGFFFVFLFLYSSLLRISIEGLLLCAFCFYRPTLREAKKKLLKSCASLRRRLTDRQRSLRSWLQSIRIVPPIRMLGTWGGSDAGKCRSRLRTRRMG